MGHFLIEWMGITTLFLVYTSMAAGWILFVFSVGWPTFIGEVKVTAGLVIELLFF